MSCSQQMQGGGSTVGREIATDILPFEMSKVVIGDAARRHSTRSLRQIMLARGTGVF